MILSRLIIIVIWTAVGTTVSAQLPLSEQTSRASSSSPIRMTFISPYNNPFWHCVEEFALNVAGDLGVELETKRSEHRLAALRSLEETVDRKIKPDYLIFQFYTGTTNEMLKQAEYAGIKTFVINTDSPEQDKKIIGRPRQYLPRWLGHMFPDDSYIGREVARQLIALRKQQPLEEGEQIEMLGIGGAPRTTAGTLRNQGAIDVVKQDESVTLNRMVFTQWFKEDAEIATLNLLKKYPNTSIIWTASDNLAAGAIAAAKSLGYTPGKDIFVGGVDCSEEGLQLIMEGSLSLTLCGHFMEAGWAVITLFDYHHGFDFKDDLGLTINLPMQTITKHNVSSFTGLVCDSDWNNVNFKKFSKFYNKDIKRYDFSLEHVREESK